MQMLILPHLAICLQLRIQPDLLELHCHSDRNA